MPDKIDELLNPECKELLIGVRETKKIVVYPLAYVDQKMISNAVTEYLTKAHEELQNEKADVAFIGKLAEVLEDSIPILVEKCTDIEHDEFMQYVTAGQLMDFVTIIMEVNFLNPIQKGTNLFVSMGSLYGSNPSLQQSVNDMDTQSMISENLLKKED